MEAWKPFQWVIEEEFNCKLSDAYMYVDTILTLIIEGNYHD